MRIILIYSFLFVFIGFFLTSCYPYIQRTAVQQGIIVETTALDRLQVGMTQDQVRFVLGNPLLIDTFSPNRWDYVFTFDARNSATTEKNGHIIVYFQQGIVQSYEVIKAMPTVDELDFSI